MRSHLLVGRVRHRRARPRVYDFAHRVYYLALDLDELPDVDRRFRALLGVERRALLSVRGDDHLADHGESLPDAVRRRLRSEGIHAGGWRITLVTNARTFGYVFNPVSFYLCRDEADTLRVVIAEVHNTHGDQCVYTLRPEAAASRSFVAEADKRFYVSPFISMDARYRFHVLDTPEALRIAIHEYEHTDEPETGDRALTLFAELRLTRRPLTVSQLLRTLVRHPVISMATIGRIHWHALRLWRRGLHFYPYGGPS